jgi:hypothetical protein
MEFASATKFDRKSGEAQRSGGICGAPHALSNPSQKRSSYSHRIVIPTAVEGPAVSLPFQADSERSGAQFFCFIQVGLIDKEAQRLALEEALVGSLGSADQRLVGSLFHHESLIEDEDAIEHPHRR